MRPLISVVMCTYNGERFLEKQISSLLTQTYVNIEIIISDDQSTDGTVDILKRYSDDERFRLFFQPVNLGPVDNFSFATREARGEYIAFADQDDIWLPGKIETLYEGIGEHLLVYSDSVLINEEGNLIGKQLSSLRKMYSGRDTSGMVFSNTVWGHAMMIKKALLPYVLPIPNGIPHDIWFAARAAAVSGIKYIDIPLTLYRQHPHTVTTTIAQKAGARPSAKRWQDFEEKRNWIGVLRDNGSEEQKPFYTKLYQLYSQKAKGRFVWPLFFFMLKHANKLFRFTNKTLPSQIIEIRKQARGESV